MSECKHGLPLYEHCQECSPFVEIGRHPHFIIEDKTDLDAPPLSAEQVAKIKASMSERIDASIVGKIAMGQIRAEHDAKMKPPEVPRPEESPEQFAKRRADFLDAMTKANLPEDLIERVKRKLDL